MPKNFQALKCTEAKLYILGWPSLHLQQQGTLHQIRKVWSACWIQRCCHWMGFYWSKSTHSVLCRTASSILPELQQMDHHIS